MVFFNFLVANRKFENVMKYMKIELDATVSIKAKALQLLR